MKAPRMMTGKDDYDFSGVEDTIKKLLTEDNKVQPNVEGPLKVIYVTGCLGFMGSYFTRKALEKGWMVYGVDKQTYAANEDLLVEFNKYKNFKFEKIDIKDLQHLYDCDYIINYAAESHVDNSIIRSDEFINSNIVGVKNLLDLVKSKNPNGGKKPVFFHISTDEVYGDIEAGAHVETDLLKPSNPYSAAKAAADMLVNAWARTYDVEYFILRPTNNYGIGQYPEKLIPISVKNLMRKVPIKLHNRGTPIRNWLHADDTAEAVMTILDKGEINNIYNVAGGFEQSTLDTVLHIIEAYYGDEIDYATRFTYKSEKDSLVFCHASYVAYLSSKDYIDLSYSRQGQDVRYALNDSKLKKLGWNPQKVFSNEIQNIVDYYRANFIW